MVAWDFIAKARGLLLENLVFPLKRVNATVCSQKPLLLGGNPRELPLSLSLPVFSCLTMIVTEPCPRAGASFEGLLLSFSPFSFL